VSLIDISKSAEGYLLELLNKQDKETIGVKVFVSEPGSPHAETCIAYCKEEDDISGFDLISSYEFPLYLEQKSLVYIEDAKVDYSPDKFGGTLTIKAPNAKVPQVDKNATLEDRINYILYSEINPSLASHGGEVSLIEVIDQETAVLQFGGGCQGCGMVDLTLKDGVEKSLLEQVSELKKVIDVTDHTYRENAYYK
jgi:Fe/S biogenesis protein NfuA|tara:strand:- start:2573 stop:3160 length:588 start_codon:yes stop_codon:yes gene_type:complete